MADSREIIITLPKNLLEEVDGIVALEQINRSELIREAMRLYIRQKKKVCLIEEMQRGYQEMAGLNLALAQEGSFCEGEVQKFFDKALGV